MTEQGALGFTTETNPWWHLHYCSKQMFSKEDWAPFSLPSTSRDDFHGRHHILQTHESKDVTWWVSPVFLNSLLWILFISLFVTSSIIRLVGDIGSNSALLTKCVIFISWPKKCRNILLLENLCCVYSRFGDRFSRTVREAKEKWDPKHYV